MSKQILKTVVGLLLLSLLLWAVGPNELLHSLESLTVEAVIYLLVLSVVLIYVSVLKWNLFLSYLAKRMPVGRLFNLYLMGYFVNLLLPSYLGGDAVRSFMIGKRVGQHQAAAATILERFTGIVAMLALGMVFMWFVPTLNWRIKFAVAVCALGVVMVSFLALSPWLDRVMNRWRFMQRASPHLARIREALKFAATNRVLLCKAFLLSFLFHSLTVVNTMVAAYAVGWTDPPLFDLFVVLPLILLIGALPVSPNGLGLQEGAFFFFLKGIGATPGQALAIGVVLRAKSYVLALLGGVSWLIWHGRAATVNEPLPKNGR